MKINIDQIIKITTHLLLKLKEHKGNEIELESDFYWDISLEEIYNPYKNPEDVTLGQLSDDLETVRKALESGDSIPYDLKKVSEIIKALSIENQTAF